MPLDEELGDAERKGRQEFWFEIRPCFDHIHFEIGPLGQIQDF